MSSLSESTGVAYTGVTTGSNVAYGVMKDKVCSSDYVSVGQDQPSVESSPQPQSEEGEYEVVVPPEQFTAVSAVSPPAVAPSQDREGGTQEETAYESI